MENTNIEKAIKEALEEIFKKERREINTKININVEKDGNDFETKDNSDFATEIGKFLLHKTIEAAFDGDGDMIMESFKWTCRDYKNTDRKDERFFSAMNVISTTGLAMLSRGIATDDELIEILKENNIYIEE